MNTMSDVSIWGPGLTFMVVSRLSALILVELDVVQFFNEGVECFIIKRCLPQGCCFTV